jgi:pimeloyl-ACP methyl ester carboxylesterase
MTPLPFQDRYLQTPGLRLHYLEWGDRHKPTLMLLHGSLQTAHMWDDFASVMAKDYHILALDWRGHGDSEWSKRLAYSGPAFMRDLLALDAIIAPKRFTLIGLSLGGHMGIIYGARHPARLQGLVLIEVGPVVNNERLARSRKTAKDQLLLPSFEDFVQREAARNRYRSVEEHRRRLKWSVRQLPDGQWTWKYDHRRVWLIQQPRDTPLFEDLSPFVPRIKVPTLVVRGGRSEFLPLHVARQMQRDIGDCAIVDVPDAGHSVPSDNTAGFTKAVREFLKSKGIV